jgi:hypothetical protein
MRTRITNMLRGLDESKNVYALVPFSLRLSLFFLRKWSDKNISSIPIPNMYYFENNHIYRCTNQHLWPNIDNVNFIYNIFFDSSLTDPGIELVAIVVTISSQRADVP